MLGSNSLAHTYIVLYVFIPFGSLIPFQESATQQANFVLAVWGCCSSQLLHYILLYAHTYKVSLNPGVFGASKLNSI